MNKKRFKWPVWFPYPSSWIRTAILIPLWPLGMASSFLMTIAYLTLAYPGGLNISGTISLVTLGVLFLCGLIYAIAHHKIVRKQKGNPTLLSIRKGFYSMLVLTFGLIPFWVLCFLFAERKYYRTGYGEVVLDSLTKPRYISRVEIPDNVAQVALILFFLIAALLFQFEYILSQYLDNKNQRRIKRQKEREGIDDELLQMKAEIERERKEKTAKCKRKIWISKNKK